MYCRADVHFIVFYLLAFVMHSLRFKFLASQANSNYSYKNLREKVQRCCANIYFNQ